LVAILLRVAAPCKSGWLFAESMIGFLSGEWATPRLKDNRAGRAHCFPFLFQLCRALPDDHVLLHTNRLPRFEPAAELDRKSELRRVGAGPQDKAADARVSFRPVTNGGKQMYKMAFSGDRS
jgi:hypothetical protein